MGAHDRTAGLPDAQQALDLVRLRAAAGLAPRSEDRLPARARRALAVADRAGAPLLAALDGAAAAEEDVRETRRAVDVASAQTRAVGAGLVAAPFLLLPLLGRLVDQDLLAFYATPTGRVVGAVGLGLLVAGAATVLGLVRRVGRAAGQQRPGRRLLPAAAVGLLGGVAVHPVAGVVLAAVLLRRRRSPADSAPPGLDEAADLVATALGGGCAPGHALRLAAERVAGSPAAHLEPDLRALALELELGLESDPRARIGRLAAVLVAATDVGTAAAPALRRLAADLRADERARVLAAAERLPAQLTFPTALALLPATLLLVGAPIVHAGLGQAVP